MRSAADLRWVLAAALGLGPAACQDQGHDDTADDTADDTGASTDGTAGTADDTTGTADDTTGGDSSGDDMGPWTGLDERPCPDDSILTYENFGGPFMLSYCTGCHHSRLPADMRQSAPIDVNFDGIDEVREWADRIWIRAADQNYSMPPVGPPDDEARTRLGEWLACGAPTDADLGLE